MIGPERWTFGSMCARAALMSAMLLAGCMEMPDLPRLPGTAPDFSRRAPQSVVLSDRGVVIAGPGGYCIDKGASKPQDETAFVLLGSCASIAGDRRAGVPAHPGLLTALVDREPTDPPIDAEMLDRMAGFLATDTGRATLARDGQAGSVTILQTLREGGALLLYLRDTSADATPELERSYWRGLFSLNGRLVTISVVGFSGQPMTSDAGLATLRAFLDRVRAETARVALPPQVPTEKPAG